MHRHVKGFHELGGDGDLRIKAKGSEDSINLGILIIDFVRDRFKKHPRKKEMREQCNLLKFLCFRLENVQDVTGIDGSLIFCGHFVKFGMVWWFVWRGPRGGATG